MNCAAVEDQIVNWLKNFGARGYVVGISGGVDSSCTSTLCAKTGLPLICVSLPIHQPASHSERANKHMNWLEKTYPNVISFTVDLTNIFETFKKDIPPEASSDLAHVNARSRLRMITLYNFANSYGYLVAGTGNKVEDFGIGFFTKYGDGGVDISPIGDLLKSEVREISKHLGVCDEIILAPPTDGLWADDRSDEDAIGASYDELEWAMKYYTEKQIDDVIISARQREVLTIYLNRHRNNLHKMNMPQICKVTK